jgi:hypothetical protein
VLLKKYSTRFASAVQTLVPPKNKSTFLFKVRGEEKKHKVKIKMMF